jgi:hypothetical protein
MGLGTLRLRRDGSTDVWDGIRSVYYVISTIRNETHCSVALPTLDGSGRW